MAPASGDGLTERGDIAALLRRLAPFTLRFFGAIFAASLLFSVGGLHLLLEPLQHLLAAAGAMGGRLLGADVVAHGAYIKVGPQLSMHVNHECTGIFVLILWGALLFARRPPWRRGLAGFAAGVLLIQAVNIARLATLAAVVQRWPGLFDYMHEYVWQGLFVALVAVMAASWPDDLEEQRLVPR